MKQFEVVKQKKKGWGERMKEIKNERIKERTKERAVGLFGPRSLLLFQFYSPKELKEDLSYGPSHWALC